MLEASSCRLDGCCVSGPSVYKGLYWIILKITNYVRSSLKMREKMSSERPSVRLKTAEKCRRNSPGNRCKHRRVCSSNSTPTFLPQRPIIRLPLCHFCSHKPLIIRLILTPSGPLFAYYLSGVLSHRWFTGYATYSSM